MRTPLDRKIEKYVDELFSGVGPSQDLFDLKEEIRTNLGEKMADLRSRGLDEDRAFREAVISLGDLGALVDDMRRVGQQRARQSVYSTKNTRLSAAGIVAGTILVLFGVLNILMLYMMRLPGLAVASSGIFLVGGGPLLTYSILVRETRQRYGMNHARAALYALSVGLVLFGLFAGTTSRFATGELFIGFASMMVFFLAGAGSFLYLALTGSDRSKGQS